MDVITASAATADGNVVLAGYTLGDWHGIENGHWAGAAVKLDVDGGGLLWRYMVRHTLLTAESNW